jgi:hypothetical protein
VREARQKTLTTSQGSRCNGSENRDW